MTTIRKIIPFEVWQNEWLLRWLHEQSREGWELVEIHRNTATFKPTTRINLVYGFLPFGASTKEEEKQLEDIGPYKRKRMLRDEYEANGWTYITVWQDFFVMQRARFDAVPAPKREKDWEKPKKQSKSQTISVSITLAFFIAILVLKRSAYPPVPWYIFMTVMALCLLGSLFYLPQILRDMKEDVRPRDISQDEYQRHLYHAKILFVLKSSIFLGNIVGIAAQFFDLFFNLK